MGTSQNKQRRLQDKEEQENSSQRHGESATAPNVTRRLQDKKDQESQRKWKPGYEFEYCRHEGELQDLKKDCQKDPNHDGFMSVKDFTRQHLPQGHRNDLVWQFIQTVISLTVRVVVNYTSTDRPESGYPNSDRRGCPGITLGSGWVYEVSRMSTEKDGGKCPCKECKMFPDKAKTKWAKFDVITATHVVFNTEECEKTRCDVGYDGDEDRGKCHKLDGLEVKYSSIKSDLCNMWCVSHHEDVINEMEMMVSRYVDLLVKLLDKYKRSEYVDISKLPMICVSHPHGMAKQITVGMCTGQQKYFPRAISFTTKTCPGSSGGILCSLGCWRVMWGYDVFYGDRSHHSKSLSTGENQSGHGFYWY